MWQSSVLPPLGGFHDSMKNTSLKCVVKVNSSVLGGQGY